MKYRTQDTPLAIVPALVGQHPEHRNGIAVNCSRCDELLRLVLGHFDPEEASFGAVNVQEIPEKTAIRDNKKTSAGDAFLAAVSDAAMPHGSVGASQINQVMRNIVFGAKTEMAGEIADSAGCLSVKLCVLFDASLAEACTRGLQWEVLSHRIQEEEPDGIACIQAGLNERAASQMQPHEMQSIKLLAKFCAAEANVAN